MGLSEKTVGHIGDNFAVKVKGRHSSSQSIFLVGGYENSQLMSAL